MKKILTIFLPALLLTVLPGCQKRFEMSLPLAVDRNELYVSKEAGTKHVTVWATQDWQAKLETEVDWVRINKVDNGSLTGINFEYDENTGISRGVKVLVTSGELSKTIYFAQKAGMSQPMMQLEKSSVSVLKDSKIAKVAFSTNLSGADIKTASVIVSSSGTQGTSWLTAGIQNDTLVINTQENLSGEERRAVVRIAVPGAYSGDGASSELTLIQSPEGVKAEFTSSGQQLKGSGDDVSLGFTLNFDRSIYPEYTVSCDFVDDQGQKVDWIKNVSVGSDPLVVSGRAKVNKNAQRSATAKLVVRNSADVALSQSSVVVTQAVSDSPVIDVDGDDQQEKDPEVDF